LNIPIASPAESARYSRFGSKIGAIVAQLFAILSTDPTAKILVYCQWASLKRKIEEAFRAFGVVHITLEGTPQVLRNSIARFQDKKGVAGMGEGVKVGKKSSSSSGRSSGSATGQANVMLCSLELKAAGLNLQCANHVFFVHPFFS
jgi:SNF2 family DNA or RNA helicase